jgi:hypothetical protein
MTVATPLFFMVGFITCLNDVIIPHLKSIFELTYAEAMLVQFGFSRPTLSSVIRAAKWSTGSVTSVLWSPACLSCQREPLDFYALPTTQLFPSF